MPGETKPSELAAFPGAKSTALGRRKADLSRGKGISDLLFFLAAVASLLLLGLRVFYNVSLFDPSLLYTSGSEEESLFGIWKFTQNQPVYADPHLIPFATSCYNWFFYWLYGTVAKAVLLGFHASDVWLPTICRVLSLLFGAAGVGICWLILGELKPSRFPSSAWERVTWAVLIVVNPLSGFWLLTARPDVGAVVFELTGLLFLLRYLRTLKWREILFAVLFLYASWSFKHNFVVIWASGSLVLLLQRKWPALAMLVLLWMGLVLITLIGGGGLYRLSLVFSQIHCRYLPATVPVFLASALFKMPFMALSVLGILCYGPAKLYRAALASPALLLLLLATVASFGLEFVLSGKAGAADYYYLPFACYSCLLLPGLAEAFRPSLFHGAVALTALLSIAAVSLILSGRQGMVDWRSYYRPLASLKETLSTLPAPVFVSDRSGNVPWIQTRPPYFVTAFSYGIDEKAGVWHERGGYEGLMREGYFGTVVTSADNPVDASLLEKYRLTTQDDVHRYYVLRTDLPKR